MVRRNKTIFERFEGEVTKAAGNYYKEKIQKKIVQIGEFSILAVLAIVLITIGIAQLIGYYIRVLDNGFNYIILGIIFLIIGFIIKR